MTKILALLIFTLICCTAVAQKQSFDLARYTPPAGWVKQTTENAIQYLQQDAGKANYCIITICKSVPGTDNAKQNFDNAWRSLVKVMVTVSDAAMNTPESRDGWEVQSGYAAFEKNGNKGVVILVSSSALYKMVNIVIMINTRLYEKNIADFLESISLKNPKQDSVFVNSEPALPVKNKAVLGSWGTSLVVPYRRGTEGSAGSTVKQYTFKPDGSYSFYIKVFGYKLQNLLLTRESGTYTVNGNKLTLNPATSVLEAWSKKDGTSEWGKLLSSTKNGLEKTIYQFTLHYFSGVQEWQLVLQADKETQRDGYYSGGTAFSKAWIYGPVCTDCFIELPN